MSWLKIDDRFPENAKVERLSDKAFRFHVAALCRCAAMLTDGRVTERDIRILAVVVKAQTWKKYVNELVSAGLWITTSHGWSINDYLDYNPSSVQVKERRERHAAQQKEYRRDSSHARSRAQARASAPSRPDPYINEQPNTLVPRDVTSEVDAENVIDFRSVLKDVS